MKMCIELLVAQLSDKKTEALWIGASVGNNKILLSGKDLEWPNEKVKFLELWISTDPELSASVKPQCQET